MANWVRCERKSDGKSILINFDFASKIYEASNGGTLIEFPTYHGHTDVQVDKVTVTNTFNELEGALKG